MNSLQQIATSGQRQVAQLRAAIAEHRAGRGQLDPAKLGPALDRLAMTTAAAEIALKADDIHRADAAAAQLRAARVRAAAGRTPSTDKLDDAAARLDDMDRPRRIVGGSTPAWMSPNWR